MKTPVKSRDEIEALLMSISYTPVEIFINLLNESNDFIRFDYFNDTVFANGVLEKSLNYLNIINLLHDLSEDNESRNIFLCIKFMHKKLCDIFREKGFNENVVLYLAFKICNYEMTIYENKIVEILEIKDYGLFDENQIELFKTKLKLARSLIKVRYDMDISFDKDLKVLEAMELTNQLSKLNNQISQNTNVTEIVQNEIPSITAETLIADEQETPTFNISTSEIFKSGFVRAFIEENYEEKIHSYYPDKDRLLYIMCSSNIEKLEVTKKQIETIKSEIHKLGREELSFAYLQSSKPESGPNFIETNQRIEFWLCQSAEDFIEEEYSFCPTYDTLSKLNDDSEFKKKLSYNNGEFWSLIHKNNWPKNHNLMLEDLVNLEIELVNQIEDDINNYNENGSWEFDFEEYEKYIESNRAIEELFNISQLLVQLNRLEMFQEFLIEKEKSISDDNQLTVTASTKKTETKTERLKAELFKFDFFEISKVKSLSHDSQSKLLDLLILNDIPYIVAMLDYLGFFKHLTNEHGLANNKIHSKISPVFDTSPQTIKGNMLALNEYSTIDKDRYTSHKHKEKVKIDYNSLK